MAEHPAAAPVKTELDEVLSSLYRWLGGVALLSGSVNLLALTGPLFMLQVYDRVLTSRSVPTLVALALIAAALYIFQAILDVARSRLMVRMGSFLDEQLAGRAFRMVLRLPLLVANKGAGSQPLRDLDNLRGFLSGPGPSAFLDLPWMPLYLLLVFLLHPLLGILATAGALILIMLTIANERLSHKPARSVSTEALSRQAMSEAGRRNAEALHAMGFSGRIGEKFLAANQRHLTAQQRASDITGVMGAISRVFRALLQSAILGLGAWLTIRGEVTAGVIIASSIISSRALAPIESVIANWRSFLTARQSYDRFQILLRKVPRDDVAMRLPPPCRDLVVEQLHAGAPGSMKPLIHNIGFRLKAGDGLGIIGPSAAGKSTLARVLVGVWPILKGAVRLDGAALDQWSPEELGRHIGYLPQDIELFDGTVGENIARFDPDASAEAIIAAARAAGIDDMVRRLPEGYETRIGEDGAALSSGQRQRIALARALYGDPFLVVLDEPNSNLDADGDIALTDAIHGIRQRGGIVVVIAHRPSAIAAVDLVMVLGAGTVQAFGPKNEVFEKTLRHPPPGATQRIDQKMQESPA